MLSDKLPNFEFIKNAPRLLVAILLSFILKGNLVQSQSAESCEAAFAGWVEENDLPEWLNSIIQFDAETQTFVIDYSAANEAMLADLDEDDFLFYSNLALGSGMLTRTVYSADESALEKFSLPVFNPQTQDIATANAGEFTSTVSDTANPAANLINLGQYSYPAQSGVTSTGFGLLRGDVNTSIAGTPTTTTIRSDDMQINISQAFPGYIFVNFANLTTGQTTTPGICVVEG